MTVAFGPYVGEFGWEVRAWAPHVYARVSRMRTAGDQTPVVIMAREGSRALYEPALALPGVDFECDWDWPKDPAEYMHLHRPEAQRAWEDYVSARVTGLKWHLNQPRPGEAFAESCLAEIKQHDYGGLAAICPKRDGVMFHHRHRHDLARERNYVYWNDLHSLVNMGMIGPWFRPPCASRTSASSLADMRRSSCVAGESSGPMHLAITAGVPIVVWGESKNRTRYEHDNWHGVPFRFIDGLQPDPKAIADAVADLLEELRGGV